MLKVGDRVYRFKIDLNGGIPVVEKHTFQVIDFKVCEPSWSGIRYNEYRLKCFNNPKIKFKDGYWSRVEKYFDKVTTSSTLLYVMLDHDSEEKALEIAREYLNCRIEKIETQLNSAKSQLSVLDEYTEN